MIKSVFALAVGLLVATVAIAQNPTKGKIYGKVIDKETNEPIIGAVVLVDGTSLAVQTNFDGQFEIGNLAPATYKLTVKYISYQTKNISDVNVSAGKSSSLNVILEESSTTMAEVVVTSTYKKESLGSLYSIQKNNIAISDGISSDIIKRTPDRNTSDVLRRVSGASIQDNKFVVIRGLADRYNAALINGSPLPSTEPDRRAFAFDLFPSNLIDNITITKAATPELPGDFAGGVVQVNTKDFPDESFLTVAMGTSYNDISTFKDFKRNTTRGGTDWLGIDDGTRALPDAMPSADVYKALTKKEQVTISKQFRNDWGNETIKAPLGQSFQITKGIKTKILDNNFGSVLALSYNGNMRRGNINRKEFNLDSSRVFDYNDVEYRNNILWGALANFSYQIGNHSKISFKNIYNVNSVDNTILRTGVNYERDANQTSYAYRFISQQLLSSQLAAEHVLSEKLKLKFDWNLGVSNTKRNEPNFRRLNYRSNGIDNGDPNDRSDSIFYASVPNSSATNESGIFYATLDERSNSISANFSIPFKVKTVESTLKVGTRYISRDRVFDARQMGMVLPTFTPALQILPIDSIFDPSNVADTGSVNQGFRMDEITNLSDRYEASSKSFAYYFMLDHRFGKRIRFVWGLRVESFQQDLSSFDYTLAAVNVDTTNIDVLPSFNFTYALTDKSNLRLAYSKTVSRPEFRELAPFQFYDFESSSAILGNPNLIRTNINNFDIRFETYPNMGEIFSVTLFYKSFENPIEQAIFPGTVGPTLARYFQNAPKAENYGIEFELRKKLNFINNVNALAWEQWDNFTYFINYALIRSRVELPQIPGIDIPDRPLQGQSPYLVNTGLQYLNIENGFGANILYNRIGRRISDVGNFDYPDIYEAPRDLIDAQISKSFLKNKLECKISVSDILAQDRIFYQDKNDDQKFTENNDFRLRSENWGSTYSMTVTYKF